jgi:hypothetical protein
MMNWTPSRLALIAAAFLIGAAVLLVARTKGERREREPQSAVAASRTSKSSGNRKDSGDETAKLRREIRGLSPREVRDALPAVADPQVFAVWGGPNRPRLLFRRFGELEGETALDEILARYGRGAFTAGAMTQAILGWLEVDRRGALAAFEKLTSASGDDLWASGMSWGEEHLISGIG